MSLPTSLKPLPDRVIRDLFAQACIGNHAAEPWLDCMRRMVRLVEAELECQLPAIALQLERTERRLEQDRARKRQRRSAVPETEM